MTGSYSFTLVAASYCVAVIASYTAIYFSTRLFELEGAKRQVWLVAGALCLGSGIWSMHFVGMSAYDMPVGMEMTFNAPLTLLSWVPALLASALALYVITLPEASARAIALAALVMGAGIFSMHYLGMHAMQMTPAIQYDLTWVVASGAIAVLASGAALLICRKIRTVPKAYAVWVKALAALVMGAAICGMHYTGMAAAIYPVGAETAADNALRGDWMGVPTAIAASVFLLLAVYVAYSDIRELEAARKRQQLAQDQAQKMAFYDSLTGLGNRSLLEQHLLDRLTVVDEKATPDPFVLLYFEAGQQQASDVRMLRFAKDLSRVFDDAERVVRYSGSSFIVVMPNPGIAAVKERILQLRIALESSGKIETWGWGSSAYPESASNTRGLILSAQKVREWVKVEGETVGLQTA